MDEAVQVLIANKVARYQHVKVHILVALVFGTREEDRCGNDTSRARDKNTKYAMAVSKSESSSKHDLIKYERVSSPSTHSVEYSESAERTCVRHVSA